MIYVNQEKKQFHLTNGRISYVFGVNAHGYLESLYFGKAVSEKEILPNVKTLLRGHCAGVPNEKGEFCNLNDLAAEYPTYGLSDFREPAFMITAQNGSRIADLKYSSCETATKPLSVLPKCDGGETLCVTLSDGVQKLKAHLYYTVYADCDAITRQAVVENLSDEAVSLDKCMSFSLDVQNKNYKKVVLQGAHLRERQVEISDITHGIYKIDSKRGVSSSQMNPFIAVCAPNADEDSGEVYGFNLIYSGNYEIYLQMEENDFVRIGGGVNSFDFSWKLSAGESFETPEAVLVYSEDGFGGMSRNFHDLYRNHLINKKYAAKSRPIVINNWEATYFDFNEQKLKNIVDSVEGTGIDMLVLDDGWFGVRNDDRSSLGDWFVNTGKLPNGVKPVADYCHKKGMKFGIWFEPEMISKNSELFRVHPDWAIQVPNRTPCEGRNQYVLDITRADVQEYLKDVIVGVVESAGADYIKWDMNRSVTENYSFALAPDCEKEFAHRYVLALYGLLDYLDKRLPNVMIEGCASGGCRFDAGILHFCPQIWTSDNSDAYSRTFIQYGTSFCYPLSAMSCHVSVCPNHQTGRTTPFVSRNDIASLGAFGYELDVTKLGDEELKTIKDKIAEYKKDANLVLSGDLYRLSSMESNLFAEEIVSKDKKEAKIVAMTGSAPANAKKIIIYPKGLIKDAVYEVVERGVALRGNTIMNGGIELPAPWGDYQSYVLHLKKA